MKGYLKAGLKKTGCVALSAVLGLSLAACTGGDETTEQETVLDEEASSLESVLTSQISAFHSSTDGKEETVYILADASGTAQKVIVSDWLKNGEGKEELTDTTDLKDVENIKGNETFSQDGETLNWKASGNDIYYQGTTDKEAPVEVKLSYTLDGKDVTPEEIAGKSGKVTIRMDYVNHSSTQINVNGKTEDVQIPFVMLSGMVLPEDHFTNISVTNGKVLSEGSNSVVMGVAMPGLQESLELDSLKEKVKDKLSEEEAEFTIPDYLEITADAKDFELGMTLTVAMSDLLSDANVDELFSMDDLEGSVDELTDATQQLEEGAGSLKDGTNELYEKSGQLDSGAKQLADGTSQVAEGAKKLAEGAGTLSEGTGKLGAGAQSLETGIGQAQAGVERIRLAMEKGNEKQTAILTGSKSLADGTAALQGLLEQYFSTYSADLNNMVNMLLKQLEATKTALSDARNQLAAAVQERDAAKAALEQACNGNVQQMEVVTGTAQSDVSGSDATTVTTAVNEVTVCDPDVLKSAAEAYSQSEAKVAEYQANVSALESQAEVLQKQLAQLQAALTQLSTATGAGLSDDQITQGAYIALIKQYASKLKTGASALNTGLQQVDAGLVQLTDQEKGIPALQSGAAALKAGVGSVKSGADQLASGAGELQNGSVSLQNGSAELKAGTAKLVEGTDTLNQGAAALQEGIQKFDQEGISKLTKLLGEDTKDAVDRLEAVLQAGKDYKTFTRISDGMDGSVKFIIKTDGVKAE